MEILIFISFNHFFFVFITLEILIFSKMDSKLPDGWKRCEDESGQVYYLTRHPQVKITKRCTLEEYHRKGRYWEMKLEDLDFGRKKRTKKFAYTEYTKKSKQNNKPVNNPSEVVEQLPQLLEPEYELENKEELEYEANINMIVDNDGTNIAIKQVEQPDRDWKQVSFADMNNVLMSENGVEEVGEVSEERVKKEMILRAERKKLESAVKKLTINDETPVNHKQALLDTVKLLNKKRMKSEDVDLAEMKILKKKVDASTSIDDLILVLTGSPLIKEKLSSVAHSKILEQMLSITSLPNNPLTHFPLDINKNHYAEIMNFALDHAPDVVELILKLLTKNEDPLLEDDVVRCAYTFSSLACSVSRQNNALKKTKSISTKTNGITNSGLDILAHVGMFETSRSFRNDRDYLASINDDILKANARKNVPQITFDNLDLEVGNVMHQMTLSFLEFEKTDTRHLSNDEKSFDEALEFFTRENVLITSNSNKELFDHYNYVVAWTLGRIIGDEVDDFCWMKRVFPKHYTHPNSDTASQKSSLFTQKPLNFCENNNRDMIQILEILQKQYLHLVAEQVSDKEAFKKDIKTIYSVASDKLVREEAEKRVKEEVVKAGVAVLHGDLLTDVRFETCKRLRRMAVTAVERFDFLNYFRLGTFHMGMNKIIQDITAGMKTEVNVEDSLSLGFFKTTLGLNHISNNPDIIKRAGNFEYHIQFCEDVGTELLIEAFKTFMEEQNPAFEKSEEGAVKLLLEFLRSSDLKYYYDPDSYEELHVHDDMMSACKDNASRALMSLVLSSVEHESDGLGLRAVRLAMIPYFLNRKQDHQDSKYAARLLVNRIWYMQASPRTKARIDLMACCNPSGKAGHGIARDQQNEHKIKSTKAVLKGMHSQLGDISVEKAVTGSNILEIVDEHDREAMLLTTEAGKTSYRYLSEAQILKMRGLITKLRPFSYDREKLEYFEKPRGIFSGLSIDQIDRFLVRNKKHFSRNSPHRAFTDNTNAEEKSIDDEVVESQPGEKNCMRGDCFEVVETSELERLGQEGPGGDRREEGAHGPADLGLVDQEPKDVQRLEENGFHGLGCEQGPRDQGLVNQIHGGGQGLVDQGHRGVQKLADNELDVNFLVDQGHRGVQELMDLGAGAGGSWSWR